MSAAPPADTAPVRRHIPWRDPRAAFAPFAREPGAVLLLTQARPGLSHLYVRPSRTLSAWSELCSAWAAPPAGGLVSLLAYELGVQFDDVPRAPDLAHAAWPDVAAWAYPAAARFDADTRTAWVEGEAGAVDALIAALGEGLAPAPLRYDAGGLSPVRPQDHVRAAIARARAYVRAGDAFQVNVSQRWSGRLGRADDPWAAFVRLVGASPAPFSAYVRLSSDRAVLTHSPERFVQVSPDGLVRSQPIKGTRPRGGTAEADERLAAALEASAKDRAENLMIVDLMRNDLARVCRPGTVRVPALHARETYAHVHHLFSTEEGRLDDGRALADLIAATFPPGSITGAPKVRAMEIIAELEGEARGPYCGALGHQTPDGAADFNVMIRTACLARDDQGWRVDVRAGGGIVADSDPDAEVVETHVKARALVEAVGAVVEPV